MKATDLATHLQQLSQLVEKGQVHIFPPPDPSVAFVIQTTWKLGEKDCSIEYAVPRHLLQNATEQTDGKVIEKILERNLQQVRAMVESAA